MAHLTRSPVAVIGKGLNNHCHARGTVALVYQFLIVVGLAVSRRFFDYSLDIFIGHIRRLCLCYCVLQLTVFIGVCTAGFNYNRNFAAYFCKNFSLCRIGLLLLAFNIVPFGMS